MQHIAITCSHYIDTISSTAWNIGSCLFGMWAATSNLILFINHLVWRNNAKDLAPIWCEISKCQWSFELREHDFWLTPSIANRLIFMGSISAPSTSLVIARRLSLIVTSEYGHFSRFERTRMVLFDLGLGLSFPIAQLIICVASPLLMFFNANHVVYTRLVRSRT